jgi:hypothetical protein
LILPNLTKLAWAADKSPLALLLFFGWGRFIGQAVSGTHSKCRSLLRALGGRTLSFARGQGDFEKPADGFRPPRLIDLRYTPIINGRCLMGQEPDHYRFGTDGRPATPRLFSDIDY